MVGESSSSDHDDDVASSTAFVVVVVAAVSAVVVGFACCAARLCQRQHRRKQAAAFCPIDDSTLAPIRKRVVLMHSNMLYASEPGGGSDKGKLVGGSLYGGNGSSLGTLRTPLLSPLVPQVRIEPCCTRSRLSSELTSMSEYEIPLDKQWEFPRQKYVIVLVLIVLVVDRFVHMAWCLTATTV